MAMLDEQLPGTGDPGLLGIQKQVVSERGRVSRSPPCPPGTSSPGRRSRSSETWLPPDTRPGDAARGRRVGQVAAGQWASGRKLDRQKGQSRFSGFRGPAPAPDHGPERGTARRSRIVRRRLSLRIVIGVDFRRAVFVRPAVDDRLEIEVAVARRAGGRPFQRCWRARDCARPAGRRRCCR